jgi:hypothetical protein
VSLKNEKKKVEIYRLISVQRCCLFHFMLLIDFYLNLLLTDLEVEKGLIPLLERSVHSSFEFYVYNCSYDVEFKFS